jgi:hypothetical protein
MNAASVCVLPSSSDIVDTAVISTELTPTEDTTSSSMVSRVNVKCDGQENNRANAGPSESDGDIDTVTSKVSLLELSSSNDPDVYSNKKLTLSDITILLQVGACRPSAEFIFPKSRGRCFQHEWFYKVIPQDSMKQCRHWLSYSVSTNAAFCLTCMLFGGPSASQTWSRHGWNDWNNGIRTIDQHENSKEHKASEIARYQWLMGKSMSRIISVSNNVVTAENRSVVACVIDCIRYLAQEMMALRGHDAGTGKLLNLFRLLAKYNPAASAYLEKLDRCSREGKKMATNFLSHANAQRLLTVMRRLVIDEIVRRVEGEEKCSIIADGTFDSSKKEATVLLLRYIELDSNGSLQPVERLVDVFTAGDSSGAQLCEQILASLRNNRINIQWVVGQGYDGAGNVRGNCQGLKTRILNVNKKAVYIWCHSHRFNLVIEAAASCCTDVKNGLGILEELNVFFSGHKRNSIFMSCQADERHVRQLKRVVCTRWNSKQAAVDTTVHCFGAILSALDQLSCCGHDSATVSGANGLAVRLRDFRFVLTLFVLKQIFEVAGPVSRQMQGVSMDLAMAACMVAECRSKFEEMRKNVDTTWLKIVHEAKTFATEHELETCIEERRKQKRRMDGETMRDDARCGEERLRVSMFIPVLDEICAQMADRFSDEQGQLMKEMSIFSSGNLKHGVTSVIKSEDITRLVETYNLDADALVSEYRDFCQVFCSLNTADSDSQSTTARVVDDEQDNDADSDYTEQDQEAEEYHVVAENHKWKLHNYTEPLKLLYQLSGYPHLLRLYWTLVTLPVTSCSAERALSRLRIIKNRLRSCMCDEWMTALMVLASEKALLSSISNDTIIDKFACFSDRLKLQLVYS